MTKPTYALLTLDTQYNVLRIASTSAPTPPALRPCYLDGVPLVMTGSIHAPMFHEAKAVVTALLEGADVFELPLPEPLPDPLSFASPMDKPFLLEYASGVDRAYLKAKYGASFAVDATARAAEHGLTIANAQNISTIILAIRSELARVSNERDAERHLRASLDKGLHIGVAERPQDPTGSEHGSKSLFGEVAKAPQAMYDRLARSAGGSSPVGARTKWPFASMAIGDYVTVDHRLAKRAQVTVHVYANRMGKRFRTQTNAKDGSLLVLRIEDKPMPI